MINTNLSNRIQQGNDRSNHFPNIPEWLFELSTAQRSDNFHSIGSTYEDLLAAYLEANPEVKSFVASHQSSQKPNRANSRMRYQRQYSNDLAAPLAFANAFGGF